MLLAVLVYLPSGCLGKNAYCPLEAANSRYLPSHTALKSPTRTTSQLEVSPSTSMTLASKEAISPPATISLCSSYQRPSISLIVGSSVVSDILAVKLFKKSTLPVPN